MYCSVLYCNILYCTVPVARLELLDEVQMRACNLHSGLQYPETPHLFLGSV